MADVVLNGLYAFIAVDERTQYLRGVDVNDRGSWMFIGSYLPRDVVDYSDTLYIAVRPNTGQTPDVVIAGGTTRYWSPFALLDPENPTPEEELDALIATVGTLSTNFDALTGRIDSLADSIVVDSGSGAGVLANTGLGHAVLHDISTGGSNTGVGFEALTNNTTGNGNTAIGFRAGDVTTTGSNNTLIGAEARTPATVSNAIVIGYGGTNRVEQTTTLRGPIMVRRDNGEAAGSEFLIYSGADVIVLSKEVALTSTGTQTVTIPAGAHFYPDEVGVVATDANTVSVQPFVKFGNQADTQAFVAVVQTAPTSTTASVTQPC
jgi:hypothetical protein